jgi:hypothetical protein
VVLGRIEVIEGRGDCVERNVEDEGLGGAFIYFGRWGNMGGGDAGFNRHAILPDENVMRTICRAECHICISIHPSVLLLQICRS